MSHGSDDHHQRLGEDALEIIERQRQAHAEQHDAQKIPGIGFAPQAGLRHEIVEHGPRDHDRGEPFGKPLPPKALTFSIVDFYPSLIALCQALSPIPGMRCSANSFVPKK